MGLLRDQEPAQLIGALLDAFPTPDALAQMLWLRLQKNLYAIALGDNLQIIVGKLVQVAEQEDWTDQLVMAAREHNPGNALLAAFAATFLPAVPARRPAMAISNGQNYYEACVLRGNRFFVDRKQLRRALQDVVNGDSRVLVVDGEPESGKTYTYELIAFLSEKLKTYRVVWIDLLDYANVRLDPDTLARRIALRIDPEKVDTMPKQQAQNARWALELNDWLTALADDSGETWWVVLDSFNRVEVSRDVRDWIEDLARRAESNVPSLRVVLLGYKDPLPAIEPYIRRETITRVERIDLKEFFEKVLQVHGRAYEPSALDAAVEHVFNRLPDQNCRRWPALVPLVRDVTQRLLAS